MKYEFDALARPYRQTETVGGEPFSFTRSYDPDWGDLSTLTYPAGLKPFTIQYGYDANRTHVVQISQRETSAALWTWNASDERGRIKTETFGDGTKTDRSYDDLAGGGAVRTIKTWSPRDTSSPSLQDLGYEYDDRWRLKKRIDNLQGHWEAFCYDDLDRLTDAGIDAVVSASCTINNPRYHYEYEVDGNLKYKSDLGSYVYDPRHPHAVKTAGTLTFENDENGNQRRRSGAGQSVATDYTPFGLPTYEQVGSRLLRYQYDADGQRAYVELKDAPSFTPTVYVGRLYTRTLDAGAAVHRYYVSSPERAVLVVSQSGTTNQVTETFSYLHADHLGSTDVVTDAASIQAGSVMRQSYDPFGSRRDPNWTVTSYTDARNDREMRGFTGHETETSLGVNMQGRIYDPSTGRFLTPDPSVQAPLNGQSWNRYSYVLNRPLNFVDPTGFDPMDAGPAPPVPDDLNGSWLSRIWRAISGSPRTPAMQPGTANAGRGSSSSGAPGTAAPGVGETKPAVLGGPAEKGSPSVSPSIPETPPPQIWGPKGAEPSLEDQRTAVLHPTEAAVRTPGGTPHGNADMRLAQNDVFTLDVVGALQRDIPPVQEMADTAAVLAPAAPAAAIGGLAAAEASGPVVIWLGSNAARTAGIMALGGAISGAISGGVQGKDVASTLRGAGVGAVVSGVNPFGALIGNNILRGMASSALTNGLSQFANGKGIDQLSWASIVGAGAGRGLFMGASLAVSPVGFEQTIGYAIGNGVSSGLWGGAFLQFRLGVGW